MSSSKTAKRVVRKSPFGFPHVFVLAVVDADDPTPVYRIERAETFLGRGGDAQVVVEDDEISKRHCAIRVDAGVCTLVDLGSLNGTELNGRELRPGIGQRLRHLDEIQLGATRFLFLTGRCKS
jgi:pSer/pThr/pTyr-binding forkhead associated (FHA) protein